jgi:hypothetical protein
LNIKDLQELINFTSCLLGWIKITINYENDSKFLLVKKYQEDEKIIKDACLLILKHSKNKHCN